MDRPERLFMFRLALALGFPHPDYLTPLLNTRQILEWIAYFGLEPFGQVAEEFRAGRIASVIANTHLRKGAHPFDETDFVPASYRVRRRRPGESQTVEEQRRELVRIAALAGRRKKG
jgi:hypothetical protein